MFSEMVPQVATLFKHTTTVGVHAFEIQLNPLCLGVSNLDRLVPVWWDSFESLWYIRLGNEIMATRFVFLIKRVNRELLFYIWRINLLAFSGRVRLFGFWLKNPLNLARGFIRVIQILFIFLCQSAIELIGNSRDRRCHFLITSI